MDQQTPDTQSETSRTAQPSFFPAQHHAPVPSAGQPDLAKRFVAVLIDGIIAAVVYSVLSKVFGLVLGGGVIGFMVGNLVGSTAALAFYLSRDVVLQGRSPGKKVMGLNVRNAAGGAITPIESAKRNVTLSLGWVGSVIMTIPILGTIVGGLVALAGGLLALYECYLVITHQPRLGDNIAGTHVVVDGAPAVAV
jgi:uncharacterized RDD family membrane protein YckC